MPSRFPVCLLGQSYLVPRVPSQALHSSLILASFKYVQVSCKAPQSIGEGSDESWTHVGVSYMLQHSELAYVKGSIRCSKDIGRRIPPTGPILRGRMF